VKEDQAEAALTRLPSLSLFYPMFNEEENIEEAVDRALNVLPDCADEFEVIVVNDGSGDSTGSLADRIASKESQVRVVHHPTNRGYGAALRSGIAARRHEFIFYTDGDNQFDLGEIGLLIPLIADSDIVTGYRIERMDPWNRKLNAWTYNLVIRVLFGLGLRDVDCAFKLYRSSVFEGMELTSCGALIDVEIFARAKKRGARVTEAGVHHFARRAGEQTGANLSVILRAFRELFGLWGDLR